jgi:esterase/lipase superfamily enzyme
MSETKEFGCQTSPAKKHKKSRSKVPKLEPLITPKKFVNESYDHSALYNYPGNYLPNMIPVAIPSQY